MTDTITEQEHQMIPLAREVRNTYQENYSYDETDLLTNGWIQAEKLEPNTRNRIYHISYERTEIKGTRQVRNFEKLHLSFSGGIGGTESYYFCFKECKQENERDRREKKQHVREVQLRFVSMNYILHQSVINSLSPEARSCLEKILGEK